MRLPNAPRYAGTDPELRRLFQWAEDMSAALERELQTIVDRMVRSDQPIRLPQYTKAQLAAFKVRAGDAGRLIYVTDDTGGATPAFSDGAAFRRVADRAVVS